ncbi:MAG: hypothetical protein U1F77_05865 [Kiritimatiellia bacterium]
MRTVGDVDKTNLVVLAGAPRADWSIQQNQCTPSTMRGSSRALAA